MTKEKRIVLEETFNATPEQLWNAWVNPDQFAKWFNPAPNLDLVIHEYDVKEGGKIKFDMPQPNGDINSQEGIFHKLDPHKEIITGEPDKSFLVRTTFKQMGDKTQMIVEVTGIPPEYHQMAIEGWQSGFTKLRNLLSKITMEEEI